MKEEAETDPQVSVQAPTCVTRPLCSRCVITTLVSCRKEVSGFTEVTRT